VLLRTGLGLAITSTYVGQALLTAQVLGGLFTGVAWPTLMPLLGWIAVLIVIRALLLWVSEISAIRIASVIKQSLRRRLYAHLLALGPGYLGHERSGTVQTTLVDSVEALEIYLGKYIPQVLLALIAPALLLVGMFYIHPFIGLITVLAFLIVIFGPRVWENQLAERGLKYWNAWRDFKSQFLDSMQGMTTLKAFNVSERQGRSLQHEANQLCQAVIAENATSLISTGILGFGWTAGAALSVGVGALLFATGQISITALLIVLLLARECFRPLVDLSKAWHFGFTGITAANNIFALLDTRPEVVERPDPIAASPQRTAAAIAFHHVAFAYNQATRPALHDLSFTIAPGETVALVGRSGAGKSTVVALLLRFFDPLQGWITLDGHELRNYSLATLRRMIAVVSQDTYLFYGSVADNLRIGKPRATLEELMTAARAANIHDFIAGLPEGYETIVGERGVKLSGGERQRIAIARAILKDAPILILDEATASVDAANEATIQEAIDRLTASRTTLVIAHRLSTVVNADRIVVIDQGRVVEQGNHHALVEQRGAYARLVVAQHGGTG
jgi:ABC-type multidrug transport system fused ATPase/permease subunit